ncbi:DegT/DnrJ/EryC1/StrS family aminotransferase [Saccharicrinis sp. FJH54]|uniref:DegT/DnrJ/EryC1/StrS family aminotransferase n=1 Tax=Saccharicrinis sp. FJH54 TaxID=3344665 RepID=UPI0035D46BD6
MNKIEMVDLRSQYLRMKDEIDAAIQNVIDSTAFVKGPAVKQFEDNLAGFLGVKHVIACGNGTDALQIALMALDLKPGDEVIAPTFTFIASAEIIALLGLTPVLVDVEPDTYNISAEAVKAAITPKTRAIIPVHLFGQNADLDAILELAKLNNLYVVEDACQSIGSNYLGKDGSVCQSGTLGDIGCTSFFPSKNLGCYGDGGAMFTNNDELAAKIRAISNHGMMVRYYHDMVGVNSRLDGIQASILDVKLKQLDDFGSRRNAAATYYDNAFNAIEELQTPHRSPVSTHVFHQYTLCVKNGKRDALKDFLNDKGIPAMVYYPVPLHLQKAYIDPRYNEGAFPVSEKLCKEVISLPMHTELSDDQLLYITESVQEFFG